jgi:hypothetical protein
MQPLLEKVTEPAARVRPFLAAPQTIPARRMSEGLQRQAEQLICDRCAVDALARQRSVGLRPTATICDASGIIPCGDRGAVIDGSRG